MNGLNFNSGGGGGMPMMDNAARNSAGINFQLINSNSLYYYY